MNPQTESEKNIDYESEKMSIDDFKRYCEAHSENLNKTWDFNLFEIVCKKCGSKNVKQIDTREYHPGSGCPTCGYESYTTGLCIIKCFDCGNALQILNPDD